MSLESDDKRIETKFNYLVEEIEKNNQDNTKFKELDDILSNKYNKFIEIIRSKIQTKCKNEMETLQVYTEYNKEFLNGTIESIDLLKPLRGYDKEFAESMEKLKDCGNEINYMEADFNANSRAITDLTVFSNKMCYDQCKNDVKKKKNSEYETRKCIESCLRYRRYNLEAYFKIMSENIDDKEKELAKF